MNTKPDHMKHLKSSYRDLHRLFSQILTVRELAEPLASFERDHPVGRVRAFMVERDYDLVGVREEGVTTGYARRDRLTGERLADCMEPIHEQEVLDESEPLSTALARLSAGRWVFVSFLGTPSGIVTRGDLQKAPMRMWLFGLISLFEMQLLRWVRDAYPDGSWAPLLKANRLEGAEKVFASRKRANDATDLADCLQLCDKGTLFLKSPDLRKALSDQAKEHRGSLSATGWESFVRATTALRDQIAHSSSISSDAWPEIVELVQRIEKFMEVLEATSPPLCKTPESTLTIQSEEIEPDACDQP